MHIHFELMDIMATIFGLMSYKPTMTQATPNTSGQKR